MLKSNSKQALIVTNLAGFLCFLWDDINILQDMGYVVSVASNGKLQGGKDAVEIATLKEKNIKFYQINFDSKSPLSNNNIIAYKQLKQVFCSNQFDLVHCHTPIVGMLTRVSTNKYRKQGTKVIYTSHGFAFTNKSSLKSWLVYYTVEKMMSLLCDAIITINKADYENAKKMFCKNVFYIHGVGVDTKKFTDIHLDKARYRKMIGVDFSSRMILSVGELSERKNHQIVIKSISRLDNKAEYTYVICGRAIVNSTVKSDLEKLAKDNMVKVVFLGHRNDISEINNCADLAIIPSIREGLGLAGIEALASGVPVIGTDIQGIKDYIRPELNGYLFEAFDDLVLAQLIDKYFKLSEEQRSEMRKNAYLSAEMFDISVSHNERKEIYEKIL